MSSKGVVNDDSHCESQICTQNWMSLFGCRMVKPRKYKPERKGKRGRDWKQKSRQNEEQSEPDKCVNRVAIIGPKRAILTERGREREREF